MTQKEQVEATVEKVAGGLYDVSRKVLLAAVGGAILAQEEVKSFVDKMVDRGDIAEKDARRLMQEVLDRRERMEKEKQAEPKPTYATKADIEILSARIAELTQKLETLTKE